jgi:hypothetical protein
MGVSFFCYSVCVDQEVIMSGHHKNRGFHQTSKRFEGSLKAQQQQSRAKQRDHSADKLEESESKDAKSISSSDSKRIKRA